MQGKGCASQHAGLSTYRVRDICNRLGKRYFWALRGGETLKPAPGGAAGNTLNQHWAQTVRGGRLVNELG